MFGFLLIGAGLGGLVSYCYFVPRIHAIANEADRQIKKVLGKHLNK